MVDACFIGGFGRSGTTLLERVIAELPGVCSLGEVRHIWPRGVVDNELCACGAPFHDCEFWTKVGEVAFGGWNNIDVSAIRDLERRVDRTRYVPTSLLTRESNAHQRMSREYAGYFARVYAAAAQVSGARIVVDSSKNAATAFALRTHPDIALRVLHVVRDSRGVAYSWTKEVARPEAGEDSQHPLMDRYPPHTSALLWDAHNLAFAALRRTGVPTQLIRYEDFLSSPTKEIQTVASFLGVDETGLNGTLTDDGVSLHVTHQAAGNPMRFRQGVIRFRQDDAWRVELPVRSRAVVSVLTAPLMVGYGYVGLRR